MKLLTLILFFSFQASAVIYQGPISSALGGSGRAGMDAAESAFLNPASLPILNRYEFTASYRDGYVQDGQHSQGWALGLSDNGPDILFPGSFHYSRTRDTGLAPAPAEGEIFHAAIGKLIDNRLSFGMSVYRVAYDVDTRASTTQWNGTLGFLYMFSRELGLAYVLDNPAKPGSDVPAALRQEMTHSVAGMVPLANIARVRLDISKQERLNPNDHLVVMTGIETVNSEFLLMRVGYRNDGLINRRFWTVGVGFNGPRVKVDYSFQKSQDHSSGALHGVDLRMPF